MSFNMNWSTLQQNLPAGTIQEKKSFGPDERFWKLARNEKDTGTAIIRLILDKDNMPFVKMFSHSIKKYDPALGKDRYYIEDSPSSIGQPCPASEKWQELMKIGTPEAKKEAELLKRKVKFITNIYVVKDPLNPQNEGKVFLWEFGYKLNDKFLSAMAPSKEDIELGTKPKELYNPIEGNSVMLKIKKSSGFFNYDDTAIMEASGICTEDEWPDIQAQTYSLSEFQSAEHFGTYDELKIKLDKTLNGSNSQYIGSATDTAQTSQTEETLIEETPKPKTESKKTKESKKVVESSDSDDDLDALMAELEDM